ncbi:DUF3179 domain-containing protein, partial [Candidatus Bipolaricaulota bacterium]|nr:DUF3179 domain-containing protein [Candidatus Bipolaricaulota bacterium]
MTEKVTRRDFVKSTGLIGVSLLTGGITALGQDETNAPSGCLIGEDKLKTFANKVRSGGVPPDGIPSIDDPVYVSAEEADETLGDLLKDDSVVFGLNYAGTKIAYPQIVMVWHEIVNEKISGDQLSVTYCPLTGTAIGYKGNVAGKRSEFGTSGKLLNSNLVMYDRATGTDSYWPQILGRSVQGPHMGDRLDFFPVLWTTWGRWKDKHPDTTVLTSDTGYIRSYGNDPYGSYRKDNTYYQQGQAMYGVMDASDSLQDKKVVVGVKVKDCALAVPKVEFRSVGLAQTELGGTPILIVYEESLDVVRAFSRKVGGETKKFVKEDGNLVSQTDGTIWEMTGEPVEGPLSNQKLQPVPFFDAMWFSWYSFYP